MKFDEINDLVQNVVDILKNEFENIGLKKAKQKHKYNCPNCTSSDGMHLFEDTNTCKCFACSKHYNVIGFIMENRKLEFKEAIQYLNNEYRLGISLNSKTYTKENEILYEEFKSYKELEKTKLHLLYKKQESLFLETLEDDINEEIKSFIRGEYLSLSMRYDENIENLDKMTFKDYLDMLEDEKIKSYFSENDEIEKEVFLYNDYLSEHKEKIIHLLDNPFKKILVTGGTGGGKTTLFKKVFEDITKIRNDIVFVFTAPLRAIVDQNYKPFSLLVGGSRLNVNSNVIFASVEKLDEIRKIKEVYPNKNICLVVDESHETILSLNFRYNAFKRLSEFEEECDKVFYLTATDIALNKADFDKIIHFKPIDEKLIIDKFNVSYVKSFQSSLLQVMKFEIDKQKIPLVFLNNKDQLKDLKSFLESFNYRVIIFDADKKDTDEFKALTENRKIENVDVILSTSVLKQGVSIEQDNLSTIFGIDNKNHINCTDIIQSVARIRHKQENVYLLINDLIKTNSKIKSKQVIEDMLLIQIRSSLEALEKLRYRYGVTKDDVNNPYLNDNLIVYDENLRVFRIDYNVVRRQVIVEFEQQFLNRENYKHLIEYLLFDNIHAKEFDILEIEIDKKTEENEQTLNEIQKKSSELKKERNKNIKKTLKNEFIGTNKDKNKIHEEMKYLVENVTKENKAETQKRINELENELKKSKENKERDFDLLKTFLASKPKEQRNIFSLFNTEQQKVLREAKKYSPTLWRALKYTNKLNILQSFFIVDFDESLITQYKYLKLNRLKLDCLEKYKDASPTYFTIRIELDSYIQKRLSNKLLLHVFQKIYPNAKVKGELTKKQMDKLMHEIKMIYNINEKNNYKYISSMV